jgi:hypothetical protein
VDNLTHDGGWGDEEKEGDRSKLRFLARGGDKATSGGRVSPRPPSRKDPSPLCLLYVNKFKFLYEINIIEAILAFPRVLDRNYTPHFSDTGIGGPRTSTNTSNPLWTLHLVVPGKLAMSINQLRYPQMMLCQIVPIYVLDEVGYTS